MLAPLLLKNIDDKWDNCWPVSNLKPLALLDLISYVFFIKKLDDRELINKKPEVKSNDFIYTRELEEFDWSRFKNMDAQSIHDLFTKEGGLIDLTMQYAHSNYLYSDFFKAPLLLAPTPKLLFNVIGIINIIETNDKNTQASIAEYLFSKAQITGQNAYEFIPEDLSQLITSIAEPSAQDFIWDPAAGNGSLLINADRYAANRNTNAARGFQKHAATGNGNLLINADGHIANRAEAAVSKYKSEIGSSALRGVESDLVQLRLAGMNMILHGIKNPSLEPLAEKSLKSTEHPTLIVSSLLFPDVEPETVPEEAVPQPVGLEKEIRLLNQIMEVIETGSRAVIVVPEILLNNNSPEIKKIRQNIIDDYNLEGVINLPQKSDSLFSGAGILIFNKPAATTTSDIWFCKMEKAGKNSNESEHNFNNGDQNNVLLSPQQYEVNGVLNKWKNRNSTQTNPDDGFYMSSYDVKANNCNLNVSDYKFIRKSRHIKTGNAIADNNDTIVTTKKENLHHFYEEGIPVEEKKRRGRLLPAIIIFILLIAGAGLYFYNFKTNTFDFFNTANDVTKKPEPLLNMSTQSPNQQPGDTAINTAPIDTTKISAAKVTPAKINKPVIHKDFPVSDVKLKNLPLASTSLKEYTVIAKAFFYSQPNETKQKSLFLQPRPGLVLHSTDEQNGFVYVIYMNKNGDTTKGWLHKKDLQSVE